MGAECLAVVGDCNVKQWATTCQAVGDRLLGGEPCVKQRGAVCQAAGGCMHWHFECTCMSPVRAFTDACTCICSCLYPCVHVLLCPIRTAWGHVSNEPSHITATPTGLARRNRLRNHRYNTHYPVLHNRSFMTVDIGLADPGAPSTDRPPTIAYNSHRNDCYSHDPSLVFEAL